MPHNFATDRYAPCRAGSGSLNRAPPAIRSIARLARSVPVPSPHLAGSPLQTFSSGHQLPFTENCWRGVRAVDGISRACDSTLLGIQRMLMMRHDGRPRSDRLAVTQQVHPPLSPFFHTSGRSLTAWIDRPACRQAPRIAEPAGRSARGVPGDRSRPGSPPTTDCWQDPPPGLPAIDEW